MIRIHHDRFAYDRRSPDAYPAGHSKITMTCDEYYHKLPDTYKSDHSITDSRHLCNGSGVVLIPEIPERLLSFILKGLAVGVGVTAVSIVWWWISRWFRKLPAPQTGLLIAISFLMVVQTLRPVTDRTWQGFLLLCVSGLFKRWIPVRFLLIAFGALLFSQWSIPDSWLRGFIVIATLWLSASFSSQTTIGHLLLPMSIAGIFLTIPDTEEVGLLLGMLIPTVLFAWPFRVDSFGRAGSAPLAAIVAWVICVGGHGRPASIIVSVGCFGLLIAFPVLQALKAREVRRRYRIAAIAVLVHIFSMFIVLSLSRTTAHFGLAIVAVIAAIGIPAILFVALLFLPRVRRFIRGGAVDSN